MVSVCYVLSATDVEKNYLEMEMEVICMQKVLFDEEKNGVLIPAEFKKKET